LSLTRKKKELVDERRVPLEGSSRRGKRRWGLPRKRDTRRISTGIVLLKSTLGGGKVPCPGKDERHRLWEGDLTKKKNLISNGTQRSQSLIVGGPRKGDNGKQRKAFPEERVPPKGKCELQGRLKPRFRRKKGRRNKRRREGKGEKGKPGQRKKNRSEGLTVSRRTRVAC